jgi:DNA polymerase I-like protein with 3'-5' exonuclease and polymerase domains
MGSPDGYAIHWFDQQRTGDERIDIQNYCREDIDDTMKLYAAMSSKIDFGRAIAFRGRYAKDVAQIERVGMPIDVKSRTTIVERRDEFQNRLIDTQREKYPVFNKKSFNFVLFEKYLADRKILWPRTKSGRLETKDRTFDNMTKAHPLMRDLYDLRTAISQVRNATDVPRVRNGREIHFLPVGPDNINRSALMPFGTLSGRNAPSTTAFAFNLATCLRTLVDPRWMPNYERDGYALAYLDYGQQEFAIQAQRSGDEKMIDAYKSGDPYTYYPQQAGYTPEEALAQRDQFKRTTLGLGYGMGVTTLCYYVGVDYGRAEELYEVHHQVFKRYWRWQEDEVLEHQRQEIPMQIPYDGWMFNTVGVKQGTCFNFFMQGGGATMLRAAIRAVHDAGITIHAPVHDALLIGAPARDIQDAVATTSRLMSDAGERVLEGVLRPRVDAKIIHNDRYRDKRGVSLWKTIVELLDLED